MPKQLLKSLFLSPKSNTIDLNFEEEITGKLIVESEAFEEEKLPKTITIILNPAKKTQGGYITIPPKKTITDENLSYFKQTITARELNMVQVKTEDLSKTFNIKINFYKEVR